VIAAVGSDVPHLEPGMRVAVNPSQPCGVCLHCREVMRNQCLDMRFMGSAMRTASLPFNAAVDAFELAGDRSKSMKVQLTF
jgi:threonine dehydrogenase-like Zn-dependent dehydrogenase